MPTTPKYSEHERLFSVESQILHFYFPQGFSTWVYPIGMPGIWRLQKSYKEIENLFF